MASTVSPEEATSPRGSTWTLVGGLAVFVTILLSVYIYVFPRLGRLPVSSTATLELRESSQESRDDWDEVTLPDGAVRFVSNIVSLNASDFQAFKYHPDSQPPEIVLLVSNAGFSRIDQLKLEHAESTFVVMLHGKPLTEVTSDQLNHTQVPLVLHGMTHADSNEAMARLTE